MTTAATGAAQAVRAPLTPPLAALIAERTLSGVHRAAGQACLAQGDWFGFLILFDSHSDRLWHALDYLECMASTYPAAYVHAATHVYTVCKGRMPSARTVLRLLAPCRGQHALPPGDLVIYRGFVATPETASRVARRTSWTRSLDVAAWFACRWRDETHVPHIAEARVPASKVLLVFEGRNEAEVVIDPRHLRGLQVRVATEDDAQRAAAHTAAIYARRPDSLKAGTP